MNFKVGDRVRVKDGQLLRGLAPAGTTGTIRYISGTILYIDWDIRGSFNSDGGWYKERFELIPKDTVPALTNDYLDIIATLIEKEIRSLNPDLVFFHIEDLYNIRRIVLEMRQDDS